MGDNIFFREEIVGEFRQEPCNEILVPDKAKGFYLFMLLLEPGHEGGYGVIVLYVIQGVKDPDRPCLFQVDHPVRTVRFRMILLEIVTTDSLFYGLDHICKSTIFQDNAPGFREIIIPAITTFAG